MNTQDTTLEDLLTEATSRARRLCAAALGIDCGSTAQEAATATRILQALQTGNILRDDLNGGLQTLQAQLEAAILSETVGYRRCFEGHHDPEAGDVGIVREIPVLSDRGVVLHEVISLLEALLAVREEARDRLRAEQTLRRLL
ncbi:hypothetical protein M8745_04340 [Lutimaribacter sp. EGI FJ00014]|uniref:Uncharacterized protein n=1 Tax=Lutimaribacter degradans TaxID=2945989 RepID=A0ACC5ZTJ5_9RHOB|nr:hypothetical protein [Lutimaribacter sp. EGI FJ00013]MCM2561361.1 hypothetical protein [Lutimaribacter sp. EGI FJ00013]MCO0635190.1 hypothetical protein [Lutimaribacter sp. EGI FJ00014]